MAFILRAAASPPTQANTPSLAEGDIWIRPLGTRAVYVGVPPAGVWQEMAVDPGFVAAGGNIPQRLAKTTAAFGATNWFPAADGIVFTYTQSTPSDVWNIQHGLVSRYVHVLAIDTSRNNTVMVPDVVFIDTLWCELRFAMPVSGMAFIRR
ncbi:MAG: hypothetical protein C5B60_02580 [Chloroflexi bacterium]|nr:MAG: hypothetical protein C5B60_02580 [Chloroflexota bacterium]